MNKKKFINKTSGGVSDKMVGTALYLVFVMPPVTEVQVSRLFSSLNVQKSSLDVPNKLIKLLQSHYGSPQHTYITTR